MDLPMKSVLFCVIIHSLLCEVHLQDGDVSPSTTPSVPATVSRSATNTATRIFTTTTAPPAQPPRSTLGSTMVVPSDGADSRNRTEDVNSTNKGRVDEVQQNDTVAANNSTTEGQESRRNEHLVTSMPGFNISHSAENYTANVSVTTVSITDNSSMGGNVTVTPLPSTTRAVLSSSSSTVISSPSSSTTTVSTTLTPKPTTASSTAARSSTTLSSTSRTPSSVLPKTVPTSQPGTTAAPSVETNHIVRVSPLALAVGISVPVLLLVVVVFSLYCYKRYKKSGRGYITLDDFGTFEGMQNPNYDGEL